MNPPPTTTADAGAAELSIRAVMPSTSSIERSVKVRRSAPFSSRARAPAARTRVVRLDGAGAGREIAHEDDLRLAVDPGHLVPDAHVDAESPSQSVGGLHE
jgi:hypothetical protein